MSNELKVYLISVVIGVLLALLINEIRKARKKRRNNLNKEESK